MVPLTSQDMSRHVGRIDSCAKIQMQSDTFKCPLGCLYKNNLQVWKGVMRQSHGILHHFAPCASHSSSVMKRRERSSGQRFSGEMAGHSSKLQMPPAPTVVRAEFSIQLDAIRPIPINTHSSDLVSRLLTVYKCLEPL